MNRCGACRHYIEGLRRVAGVLPKGWSCCANEDRDILRMLRRASGKPLKPDCYKQN